MHLRRQIVRLTKPVDENGTPTGESIYLAATFKEVVYTFRDNLPIQTKEKNI